MTKFDHFAERGPLKNLRKAYNDLREEVKAQRIANGVGYKVKRTSLGTILQVEPGKAGTVEPSDLEIKRFQVIDVRATYLECYETKTDGSGFISETTRTQVLRPYATRITDGAAAVAGWSAGALSTDTNPIRHLQRNLTRTDTTLGLSFTMTQKIYPAYLYSETIGEGSWIFAAKNIKGYSANDGASPPNSIIWVDINVDGRAWTFTETQQVAVCVNGVTKYMWVVGSALGVAT